MALPNTTAAILSTRLIHSTNSLFTVCYTCFAPTGAGTLTIGTSDSCIAAVVLLRCDTYPSLLIANYNSNGHLVHTGALKRETVESFLGSKMTTQASTLTTLH